MPLVFNVHRKDQYVTVGPSPTLNPNDAITIEAVLCLQEDGQDPTVMARPIGTKWIPPYATYRLGFYGASRLPEFQLLFELEDNVTTLRGIRPIELGRRTHIAGTYDGKSMRLFIEGTLEASLEKQGKLAMSNQPTVFATRSSTDVGGMFVGTLEEFRFWNIARSIEEINLWKHRLLPVDPCPTGLVSLWSLDPSPPDHIHNDLTTAGFSQDEVTLSHWAYWYALHYNKRSRSALRENALACYSAEICLVLFVRANDGYLAMYSTERFDGIFRPTSVAPGDGLIEVAVFDRQTETLSEVIQSWTGNCLRIVVPRVGDAIGGSCEIPADVAEASDIMISRKVREQGSTRQQLTIWAPSEVDSGRIKAHLPGRFHAISPLVQTNDGSIERQFTWLFVDFWFGELTRDVLHLQNAVNLLMADLEVLQWTVDLALSPQELVNNGPQSTIAAIRQLLQDFELLLDKPNVDEVKDIQPFLAEPKHWILLSPSRKQVWPQKMLGNKWKVDFVVCESDDSYTAIEIESPNFQLYTAKLDPHHKLTHAEQQVRDYCEYVDQNRDTVEREEGLTRIFRPRGVVVIGRRKDLSAEATRKLVSRNRDSGRYTIMVYDDLIDRVRAVIDSIEATVPAQYTSRESSRPKEKS